MHRHAGKEIEAEQTPKPTGAPALFIDAFAGCGGLSLGLLRAGWQCLFAIDKDSFACDTFKANLLEGRYRDRFHWPAWLPQGPTCIEALLSDHGADLAALRGKVALLAGGPPCQGFSSAGRRDAADPRNDLMRAYLQLVELLEPDMVLLENVKGITLDISRSDATGRPVNYADLLRASLGGRYDIYSTMAKAMEFGVPQARTRFILVALHRRLGFNIGDIAKCIDRARQRFLRRHRLVTPVSALAAISDLEVTRNGTVPCPDSPGFDSIGYSTPRTHYQRIMHDGCAHPPCNTRLAHHSAEITNRFSHIITSCRHAGRLNISIPQEMRDELGIKKQAIRVLDPDRPAPTITGMPDDLIHYAEPRTLTVRENARLQGFPDWFSFKGKYTTGGHLRRLQVPRFTQVANAVPPMMAEVLGNALFEILSKSNTLYKAETPKVGDLVELHINEHGNIGEIQAMFDKVTA